MTEPYLPAFAVTVKRVWFWSVIRGVVAVLFGLIAMISPVTTASALALFIGIFFIIDGIVAVLDGIRFRGVPGAGPRLVLGLLALAFGVVIVAWPHATTVVVMYLVAVWALIIGLIQVFINLSARGIPGSGWGWGLLVGVLTVIFSILVFAQPRAGIATIMWLIGGFAVVIGIVLIILGFTLRSQVSRSGLAERTA